jgi:hypothetical protein
MIMELNVTLPSREQVGEAQTWDLPFPEGELAPEGALSIQARFLGLSSSYQGGHTRRGVPNHPHREYAARKVRCSACRWFESRIFRETGGTRRYLVYNTGRSIVPGEELRVRYEWCRNASEVLEALITRNTEDPSAAPYFTVPAARVLAQAAGFDTDLRDSWENRAVL